jgi:FkbM family methyltransferase
MKHVYSSSELEKCLNPHLLTLASLPVTVEVKKVNSLDLLLKSQRFDLLAKYLYVKYRVNEIKTDWYLNLYIDHIRAFSSGSFREGDGLKNNLDDYINSFNLLIDNIKENGFDSNISIIPIDESAEPIDGAHRIAIAAYLGITVDVVEIPYSKFDYGYKFFLQKGFSEKYADRIALEYCKLNSQAVIVNLHPVALGYDKKVEKILNNYGNIFYKKEVMVNGEAPFLLTKTYYKKEKWIGSANDGFSGARRHSIQAFKNMKTKPVRVYLYYCNKKEDLIKAKSEIRDLYNVGNYSVHINDSHDETIDLAQLWFNQNSIHMLNNSKSNYYNVFMDRLSLYDNWLKNSNFDSELFCIDGSSPMSVYGLRQSADLDFLHLNNDIPPTGNKYLNSHNEEAKYYKETIDQIVINPDYHFFFNGLKFISLDVLKRMKQKRNEYPKDIEDVYLLDLILEKNIMLVVKNRAMMIYLYSDGAFKQIVQYSIRRLKFIYMYLKNKKKYFSNKFYPALTLSIDYKGFTVFYSMGTSLVSRLKNNGSYEKETCDAIVKDLSEIVSPIMIDVGANIGLISLAVMAENSNTKIFAFEPGEHQFKLLQKTITSNNLDEKITISELALSNKTGHSLFSIHSHQDASGDGFIDTERAGQTKIVSVKTMTLDDWWFNNGQPNVNLIKLDTEGAEFWILQGASKLIQELKPVIFIEIHLENIRNYPFNLSELLDLISDLKYQLYSLGGECLTNEKLMPLLGKEDSFVARAIL